METTIAIVEAYAKFRELSRVMTEIPQREETSVEQKTLLQRGGLIVENLMTQPEMHNKHPHAAHVAALSVVGLEIDGGEGEWLIH